MDKKQGSDDAVKRTLDDDDTEGQKVTHRAIPDDAPAPDDAMRRSPVDIGDEDDTEGQKVTHR